MRIPYRFFRWLGAQSKRGTAVADAIAHFTPSPRCKTGSQATRDNRMLWPEIPACAGMTMLPQCADIIWKDSSIPIHYKDYSYV